MKELHKVGDIITHEGKRIKIEKVEKADSSQIIKYYYSELDGPITKSHAAFNLNFFT